MRVAIVGAGPAGAFCGERLAAAGHAVTLFDPSHPREKACGGGITPGILHSHPELAALRPLGRPAHVVHLTGPRGSELEVDLPEPIDIYSRRVLDAALLERAVAAGAKHRSQRVRRTGVEAAGAWLETPDGREDFDFVVGADGAASGVRRCLLGARPGSEASYATAGFHVEGLPEERIVIEFTPEVKGYFWVFPRPGHASAGIALPVHHQNGAELRARVLQILERRYPGCAALPLTPYAASIPCPRARGARHARLGGPHFALIGDAANQTDAITGEGIHQGLAAAGVLAAALDAHGPRDAAAAYQRTWWRGSGREVACAARWAERYYHPLTAEWMLRLGGRSRRARRVMRDMLAMLQPYSSLRSRLLREAFRGGAPR